MAETLRLQYTQVFADMDDSQIDAIGSAFCALARANNLKAAVFAAQTNLGLAEADARTFTNAVLRSYCLDAAQPGTTADASAAPSA